MPLSGCPEATSVHFTGQALRWVLLSRDWRHARQMWVTVTLLCGSS